ncbi:MAG: 4Fe-4S dicluster domain-containing protein [bacterium]
MSELPVKNNPVTIEDKLGLLTYKPDHQSHISVDQEIFKADPVKAVLYICPAKVYELNEATGECTINHENCVECGTCHVAAPHYVNWFYPEGGKGVHYHLG